MKNIESKWGRFLLAVLAGPLFLTSCMDQGLDELPAFSDAKIVNVFTEFRYADPVEKNADGSAKIKYLNLPVTRTYKLKEETPGAVTDSVLLAVSVPAASGSFTTALRDQVKTQNLVVYGNISTAASITPLSGAPVLGAPGDFSLPRQYEITAADKKTSRVWTVKITKLSK